MPVIARINGVVIRMFFGDHPPPHFHATHSEKTGLFNIAKLEMIEGDLSTKDQKAVKYWAKDKQDKLKRMWELQKINKI